MKSTALSERRLLIGAECYDLPRVRLFPNWLSIEARPHVSFFPLTFALSPSTLCFVYAGACRNIWDLRLVAGWTVSFTKEDIEPCICQQVLVFGESSTLIRPSGTKQVLA